MATPAAPEQRRLGPLQQNPCPRSRNAGRSKNVAVRCKNSRLDIKGRIHMAMKGTKEERSILIRDSTKLIALAVLESPKLPTAK